MSPVCPVPDSIPQDHSSGFISLEDAPKVRAEICVALASRCPDPLDFPDADATAAVRDHSSFLQFARDIRHAGAPHAYHLGEKLLGQRKIDTGEIVHPEKQLAGAGL